MGNQPQTMLNWSDQEAGLSSTEAAELNVTDQELLLSAVSEGHSAPSEQASR